LLVEPLSGVTPGVCAVAKSHGAEAAEADIMVVMDTNSHSDQDLALQARIISDPQICGGRPVIKGTRMRVSDIVEAFAAGATRSEMLADFPYLADEDISAALAYAARAVDHRVVHAA
jgi:uncharacterized protein (DUF433 family)